MRCARSWRSTSRATAPTTARSSGASKPRSPTSCASSTGERCASWSIPRPRRPRSRLPLAEPPDLKRGASGDPPTPRSGRQQCPSRGAIVFRSCVRGQRESLRVSSSRRSPTRARTGIIPDAPDLHALAEDPMKPVICSSLVLALAGAMRAAEIDWQRFQDTDVIEIVTQDEDGESRETSIWIVTFGGHGYVRTNDSRWLANIRRGSNVALRLDEREFPVTAREPDDAAITARVEEGFKQKYGFMQRVMSTFRMREPTLLELTAR